MLLVFDFGDIFTVKFFVYLKNNNVAITICNTNRGQHCTFTAPSPHIFYYSALTQSIFVIAKRATKIIFYLNTPFSRGILLSEANYLLISIFK